MEHLSLYSVDVMLGKRTLQWLAAGVMLGLNLADAQVPPAAESDPPKETVIFPLSEVHAGLQGVAYTVFSGVVPEAMSVEILGTLTNGLGPHRDLILARLHGSKPEYTGVVAGMSGSPVYINRRLVGALSYRIGQFSKEPIAGITPIEQMLASGPIEGSGLTPVAGSKADASELQQMEAPLVFAGFSQDTLEHFGDGFRAMGLVPVSGLGGADTGRSQPEPLEPGSAVSALLVQGDLSVAGTCTVSYLVKDRLLACGHPLTQSGGIDVPMAKAEVLATLASPLNSFKIVNTTEVVGAFTSDRSSAIAGLLGQKASMIPVTVLLENDSGNASPRTTHLQVATHRELTPQLMMTSLYQCLQQAPSGSATTSYKVMGQIDLVLPAQQGDSEARPTSVQFESWQSQSGFNGGAVNTALAVGERFTALFANPDERPVVTGVSLHVKAAPMQRTATLEAASISRPELGQGEAFDVEALLQPYQRAPQRVTAHLRLPAVLEPGPVRLLVSDGATLDRLLEPATPHPLHLLDTVSRLNATHANDRIYVTLLTRAAQAVLDAAPLPDVPLSMANVLEPLRGSQRIRLTGESVVELGSVQEDDAISGSQVLTVMVR